MTLNCGDLVREKITGFGGIITAKTEYWNGCRRVAVQGKKLKEDGTLSDEEYFDEQQVELVTANAVGLISEAKADDIPGDVGTTSKAPGGPMADPPPL